MSRKGTITWVGSCAGLFLLYYVFFFMGSTAVSGVIPEMQSEPGLVPLGTGLLLLGVNNTLVVILLVISSRWGGWKWMLWLSFAYYGVTTLLTQIETWYFLSSITVGPKLLFRLFVMGLPVAFIYVPISVLILRRGNEDPKWGVDHFTPVSQWLIKLILIVLGYLVLYWSAGYFIAWQNPELRAFYGSSGEIQPFWKHTITSLLEDPGLFLLQMFRALLWLACGLPVILGSKLNPWWTALLVGFFFSHQNIVHILENPLMPVASVRISHLIETTTSTFVFGMIMVALFHRKHRSIRDFFGLES